MPKGQDKEYSRTPVNQSESLKDVQNISNVLLILDSQTIKTNPFGANVSGENSYRRAERIGAALHLVTSHVPDTEPLRSLIREGALELLTRLLELRAGFRAPASEKGQAALAVIRKLVSMVKLLAVSGFISISNATAVAEALDDLGSLIVVSQRSALAEQLSISPEDLMPTMIPIFPKSEKPRLSAETRRPPIQKDIKDMQARNRTSAMAARPDRIMDILKAGGTLGINDIASNLPQYSEKMIQRELADLVDAGKVRKHGEKRWSRYELVT